MTGPPRRLKLLDRMLDDLARRGHDPMLISEFDGLIAGLLVCPELIPPSDWLPMVWSSGEEEETSAPVFEDDRQLHAFIKLVMEHYNATGADLLAGRYAPIFDVDTPHDDILWEIWIEGFDLALHLRPEAWEPILTGDDEGRIALNGLSLLADVAAGEELGLPEDELEELKTHAPDLIGLWLDTLHARRPGVPANDLAGAPVTRADKVGRNDPCPCGSGKKYKKCCGAN